MIDVERIAAYMNERGVMGAPIGADNVVNLAANNPRGQCGMLLAMLADVRREEREACLADIDAENELSKERDENDDAQLVRMIRTRIRRRAPQ